MSSLKDIYVIAENDNVHAALGVYITKKKYPVQIEIDPIYAEDESIEYSEHHLPVYYVKHNKFGYVYVRPAQYEDLGKVNVLLMDVCLNGKQYLAEHKDDICAVEVREKDKDEDFLVLRRNKIFVEVQMKFVICP